MFNITRYLSKGVKSICRHKKGLPSFITENEAKLYSSYRSHRDWDPDSKISYEISKDPNEWKFVERLLPSKLIPDPSLKENYSSGWWPQNTNLSKNYPYTVRRSKNHMLPVYLKVGNRGLRKLTIVRHIKGDIWAFEQELKEHLLKKLDRKTIGTQVDEVAGKIIFRGDFVYFITDWFKQKGF